VATGIGLRGGPVTNSGMLTIDPTVVPLLRGNQTFSGANTITNAANSFAGNGAGLTSLNADNLTSGTIPDARLSANVALLSGPQTLSGDETTAASLRLEGPGTNNWLMLSNGSIWLPPFALPGEEQQADGQRGGIFFGSAGDLGPNPGNN